jgi:hypothetical protein
LIGIARKDIFGVDTGRIGLTRDSIKDMKAKTDIIAGVDITITI